jgi:branched-chain amino acid transport system substrate-binding protein
MICRQPFCSLIVLVLLFTASFGRSVRADELRDELRFGATLSLSSSTGPFAQACLRGIEMAVEDVNAAGGVKGRQLEVLIEDFQETDLKRAAAAAHKLIEIDKVAALLSNWSEDAEVVAPIAEASNLISMTLGAGGPGASRFAATAFRATTSDGELARAAVHAEQEAGSKRACLVVANTGYYVDVSRVIKGEWESSGGKVVLNEAIEHGAVDVLGITTRLRRSRCDSIFIWAAPATIGPLITHLRNQKVEARRVLPWFADTPEILERTRGDSQVYTLHRWDLGRPDFAKRYQDRYGEALMRPVGNCYDYVETVQEMTGINVLDTDVAEVEKKTARARRRV